MLVGGQAFIQIVTPGSGVSLLFFLSLLLFIIYIN